MNTNRSRLFAGASAAMFVFGIVLAILGALFGLPEMRERLGIDLVQQGDIFLALFFGIFLSTIVVGPMIDSFGNKAVLTTSAALVSIALFLFATSHSFIAAVLAALLLGFGGGGLNTAANALVSDIYPENRGAMLNILGTFFGIGALFVPLLAATITGLFTIPELLLGAAALAAMCAVLYLVLPFPSAGDAVGFSMLASIKAIRTPGVLVFGLALICQSGNEAAIGGWTSTYVGSLGASPATATWILSAYWAALMTGRAVAAPLLRMMTKPRLVLAGGIGSIIGVSILLMSHSIALVAIGAIVVGFSFATIYPTELAIAADRYQRQAGTIFGLLIAIGLIGGMGFPWIIGHLSERFSLRTGMIMPLIGAIVISMIAALQSRKSDA